MADALPTEPAVEARLHDFLAAELRRAELDFPHLRRRRPPAKARGLPLVVAVVGLAVLAFVTVGPRLLDRGSVGAGAIAKIPSAPVVASATPSGIPSVTPGVIVDCGRISPAACATAIDLVRAGHAAEVASATRIVMDDTCPPTVRSSSGTVTATVCDRIYPFDSIVVFVTAGGDTTGWYAFSVVGLVPDTPTTVKPWVGDIPPDVVRTLTEVPRTP